MRTTATCVDKRRCGYGKCQYLLFVTIDCWPSPKLTSEKRGASCPAFSSTATDHLTVHLSREDSSWSQGFERCPRTTQIVHQQHVFQRLNHAISYYSSTASVLFSVTPPAYFQTGYELRVDSVNPQDCAVAPTENERNKVGR